MATKINGWQCDTCKRIRNGRDCRPWLCPGCKKEVCEHCFDTYAHCKKCCKGKTRKELRFNAIKAGFDFDL